MDYLCPEVEQLVACYSCGTQTLPPFQLCEDAHISCPPCFKYMKKCDCGMTYTAGPHMALNGVVEAMKFKCRYAMASNDDTDGNADLVCFEAAGAAYFAAMRKRLMDDCNDRWYTISELRDHYRSGCRKNVFKCPMKDCGYFGRTDTIVEHYEEAHGPIEEFTPEEAHGPIEDNTPEGAHGPIEDNTPEGAHGPTEDITPERAHGPIDDITPENPLHTNTVTFKIDLTREEPKTVIRKVFNGYFLCSPMKPRNRGPYRNQVKKVSLRNINPCDPLQYNYTSSITARVATVKISLSAI